MNKELKIKSVNQLIEPYPGKWVALSADENLVLSVAKTAQRALDQAHGKGERFPHLIKAPDSSTAAFIY